MISYFFLDVFIVFLSFIIINHNKSLTFYHPGTILLLYHVFTNTLRFFSVMNGSELAFLNFRRIEGANIEELMRALFYADIGLLSSSIAIAIAENVHIKTAKRIQNIPINRKLLNGILAFTIPMGIVGAATQLYIPTIDANFTDAEGSNGFSFAAIISTWFGLSMLALIYFRGFKVKYLLPLLIYLFIIAIQGANRYRLVLPCMFLLICYLYHYKLKWPKPMQFVFLFVFILLTLPLKEVGKLIQEGGSITDVSTLFEESINSTSNGSSGDQQFLDQFAMTLTEIDRKGKIYYGGTIIPLLVLPIPRSGWAEKPTLNQWQVDIASKNRPFDKLGSIATIYGESYANFRLAGVVFLPALLFYFLTIWYRKIKNRNMLDMGKFLYTLIFVCMIQVLRDGFISLFLFPVLINMPLFLIYVLHRFTNTPKKKQLKRNEKNNFNRSFTPSI